MTPTASVPFHPRHAVPVRNTSGPMPWEEPLFDHDGRNALGKRVKSVIGMVLALPA